MTEHLEAIRIGRDYKKVMIPCEVCGGSHFSPLQTHGRIAEAGVYGTLNVMICDGCGFKMTNPRYEDRFYQDYYERLYREVAFGAEKPSDLYVEQQKLRGAGVQRYAQKFVDKPGRMLDHGCASAATSLPWRDAGWNVRGVDPHRPSIELGRELFGLDLEIAAGESLPYADDSFELVLSLGSTEHAYDIGKAMREVRRVLVPGGWFLIRWRTAEMFGSPLEYYNHNHYRFFTKKTWRLMLRRYGFEIIDQDETKYEGSPNYSYIMARATLEPSDAAVREAIAKGEGDDAAAALAWHDDYRKRFRERVENFLDEAKPYEGKPLALFDAVKSGQIRWTLMFADPEWVVNRALLEARRYIEEYDAGRAG